MNYGEATFPAGTRVCGVRMRPLTLGHVVLLDRLHSPFVGDGLGQAVGAGDIGLLFYVCSRPWRRALAGVSSFHARLRIGMYARGAMANTDAVAAELHAWIGRQFDGPRIRRTKHHSRLGAPEHALIKVVLMAELHLSEEECLDRTVQLSVWDLAVVAERKGGLDILSREQRQQDADFFAAARRVAEENRLQKEAPRV